MDRTLKFTFVSLVFNIAFAIYHLVLGFITSSCWLLTLAFVLLGFKHNSHCGASFEIKRVFYNQVYRMDVACANGSACRNRCAFGSPR